MKNHIYLSFVIILAYNSIVIAGITQEQQQLNNQVQAYYGLDADVPHGKCGFSYQHAVRQIYNQLSPSLQIAAEAMLEEPERQMTINSPSGHFNIHYDTLGIHAVPLNDLSNNGIPDYIDSAIVFLDYTWHIEIDVLGYWPPLGENGELTAYNIYFTRLSPGFYGQTSFGSNPIFVLKYPYFLGKVYPSYIELSNNFQDNSLYTKGLNGMRVAIAHEFFHAIQLCYNFWGEETFFYEMSSSWIEEIVYPEINDYFYLLPKLFNSVQNVSLFSNYNEYGNGIYLNMLAKKFGNIIIRDVWNNIRTNNPRNALDNSLKNRKSSLSLSLVDYGEWMYYTGDRAIPGSYYDDADSLPMLTIDDDLIFSANSSSSSSVLANSHTYKLLKAENVIAGSHRVLIDSDNNVSNIEYNIINRQLGDRKPTVAGMYTSFSLDSPSDEMVFVISNSANTASDVNFHFSSDSIIGGNADIRLGPNPVNLGLNQNATFYFVPPLTKVVIMDINQKPIRKMTNTSNYDQLVWDMKDTNGKEVSTGIYLYIVMLDGKSQKIGKIAVIR